MNKKIVAALLVILISGTLAITLSSCRAKSGVETTSQLFTVQRGNLTIDITGAGNLALSKTEDLAFEIAGYVQEVMVKEGETVTEGEVVAQLDTSEWDKQLKTLQKALETTQRSLTTAQANVTKAQRNLTTIEGNVIKAERNLITAQANVTKAQSQVSAKELALRQAQLDLDTAEYNLSQIEDVKIAQAAVDGAQNALDLAKANFQLARVQNTATSDMTGEIVYFNDLLEQSQKKLNDILKGKNLSISSTVALQISQYQLRIEQCQRSVQDAQIAIEDAKTAVSNAQLDVEDAKTAVDDAQLDVEDAKTAVNNALLDQDNAEQNVKDAQSELDEAKNLSPLVKAPFAGFITKVNVIGGDEAQKGTIAMQLADPAKFTADIVVGESDITKVKEGGSATVQVDPIPGLTLPATVTHISPTATVQSGVVSYKVTVEMENLQPGGPSPQAQPAQPPGPSPTPLTPVPDGTSLPTATPVPDRTPSRLPFGRANQPSTGQQRSSFAASQTSEIRAGMSVTVSIAVEESRDVLLVPNQSIIYSGRNSQVQVMKDGAIETRAITTGINNWQYTEVTGGLSEGEQVVIPVGVTTGSTSRPAQTSRPGQAPIVVPGGGRLR